ALRGDVGTELALAGNSKETFPSSRAGPLGGDSYLTPERDKREGQTAFGISEEQRKKPVGFAAVTIAEFGIAQENVTPGWKGNSPASLKFRRRSTIGLRGSPENNTLIRYLAQQRSNR
ncbi:CDCA2 protein, partial [Smithornis capensis]|nr:CDCA2 protein [Smithornis capensis]